jgi:AmpE protein
MKLIALLIGLMVERLATQLFHFRELRWFDRVIDAGCAQIERLQNWPAVLPVAFLALLLAAPVFVLTYLIGDALLGFPYLFLAVVVLFFSLGPNDIGEDVDDYCSAIEADDPERIRVSAKKLLEKDVPEDGWERIARVEEAVFVQANNRLFAVVFWFVVLGPLGAWGYRVTDLIRRRAVFSANRLSAASDETGDETAEDDAAGSMQRIAEASTTLHSWLAWIPARLTALGYALAGSFDGALAAWRAAPDSAPATTGEQNENLLARVGTAALALPDVDDESQEARGIRGAAAANSLVFRLLFLWALVIAGMTLYGATV